MTLSTYLVANVQKNVAEIAEQLYALTRSMLRTPEHIVAERVRVPTAEEVAWMSEQKHLWGLDLPYSRWPGVAEINHEPGLGLPAWLLMKYRPDGPTVIEFVPDEYDLEDEDSLEYSRRDHAEDGWANGSGTVQINWDTGYSYCGDGGENCSDLHAAYILVVGKWLDERGIAWSWRNEFTGDWHVGRDGIEELSRMFGPGSETHTWFFGSVTPTINAMFGAENVVWG